VVSRGLETSWAPLLPGQASGRSPGGSRLGGEPGAADAPRCLAHRHRAGAAQQGRAEACWTRSRHVLPTAQPTAIRPPNRTHRGSESDSVQRRWASAAGCDAARLLQN